MYNFPIVMKKAIFFGFAALVMLAVLSCEIDEQKDRQNGIITLNGPEITRGRALDGPIAEAVTNFYEAAFQRVSDSKIIRATWDYAQRGRIYLEPGDYTLILMAGRIVLGDKILLGVGQATGIDGGGSVSTDVPLQVTIEASTTDLYFTAYPLMNDINGAADSTFKTEITTFPFPIEQYIDDGYGNSIPVFPINRGATTTAAWKFGLGALPDASGDKINVFGPSILVTGTPAINDVAININPKLIDASFTGLTLGTALTGTFNMSFTAPNAAGMVQISLNVPVVAIANTDKPVIWYIRGGLNNGELDNGKGSANKSGGAIALGF